MRRCGSCLELANIEAEKSLHASIEISHGIFDLFRLTAEVTAMNGCSDSSQGRSAVVAYTRKKVETYQRISDAWFCWVRWQDESEDCSRNHQTGGSHNLGSFSLSHQVNQL